MNNLKINLRKLSNDELDKNLKTLVGKEREVLSEIIVHIIEIDTRRLFLSYGYPNLFEYLTEHVGYSSGSAQRRIVAARLAHKVPDVVTQIEQGHLNLSQVNLIHQSIRQAETADAPTQTNEPTSTQKRKVSIEEKKALVNEVSQKSMQESEKLVKKILGIAPKTATKTSHQQDGSIRLEITFSEEQWKKLNKLRELSSHSVPDGSWDQVLEHVCDQIIKQKEKSQGRSTPSRKTEAPATVSTQPEQAQSNLVPTSKEENDARQIQRTAIPVTVKRIVIQRDQGCCQYVDKNSGHKCGSTWQLSLDHIKPVWAGGGNDASNLRVLCANHNREVYRRQAGIRFV